MLQELFPRFHGHYSSLPLLGPSLEGFAAFLVARGYPRRPVICHLRAARRVDERLRRCCRSIVELTRAALHRCAPPSGRAAVDPSSSAVVRLLEAYLAERGLLPSLESSQPADQRLAEYGRYLARVRGLVPLTIRAHVTTASQFIAHLNDAGDATALPTAQAVEAFVSRTGHRVSRATLQHIVAHLRSFLRFLVGRGEIPFGLDSRIDTPRVYRGERLPRSLPWSTVRAFLESIDRSTALGKRDYAMFQLVTTYGLRCSEVVSLRLDDIQWRAGCLRVSQRKTASPLTLPLTDAVGDSLVAYLRGGRPQSDRREVFLRHRAPAGVLKAAGVSDAFQAWSKRSGLSIPYQGCHCLRHSYAVHLLRQGTSLKTIGDILGHRSAESTCVYLRLAVEDLREVALDLPADAAQEVKS
jgi:integrase/recombinase XerD